jgi:hypothetical protein
MRGSAHGLTHKSSRESTHGSLRFREFGHDPLLLSPVSYLIDTAAAHPGGTVA